MNHMDIKQCEENLRHCRKAESDIADAQEFLRIATNVGVEGLDEPVRKLNYAKSAIGIVTAAFKAAIRLHEDGHEHHEGSDEYTVTFSREALEALHWFLREGSVIDHLKDETGGQAVRKSHLLATRARIGDILSPPALSAIAEKEAETREETPMVDISIAIDPDHPIACALFARAANDLQEFANALEEHGADVVSESSNCAWMPNGRLEANYDLRDPRDECWD